VSKQSKPRPCPMCQGKGERVATKTAKNYALKCVGICVGCNGRGVAVKAQPAHQRHPDTAGKRAAAIRGTGAEMKETGDGSL
jgi:DnaJ-class molecular chaperone